jgi:YgiT-type zinc finger domain-containing protein
MTAERRFEPPSSRRPYPARCSRCDGEIRERRVTLVYTIDASPKIVHGVPTGVCQSCGERYLRPEVAARVEELLTTSPPTHEEIPAWEFASAG